MYMLHGEIAQENFNCVQYDGYAQIKVEQTEKLPEQRVKESVSQ
jgi:hypothetical protein